MPGRPGRRLIPITDRKRGDVNFRYVGPTGTPTDSGKGDGVKWASCQMKVNSAFSNIPRTRVTTLGRYKDTIRNTVQNAALITALVAAGGIIWAFGTPTVAGAASASVAGELALGAAGIPGAAIAMAATGGGLPTAGGTIPKVHRSTETAPAIKKASFTSFKKPCSEKKVEF